MSSEKYFDNLDTHIFDKLLRITSVEVQSILNEITEFNSPQFYVFLAHESKTESKKSEFRWNLFSNKNSQEIADPINCVLNLVLHEKE